MMTKDQIRSVVVEEISKAHQAQTGVPPVLTDATRPIGDLSGFDSPLGEDVTGVICLKLNIPAKALKCPFTKRAQGKYATLDQVVDDFCAGYARQVPVNA
jgi:hypothetical protein